MPDAREFFFRRGGARVGRVNYTWPLATLTANAERLTLTTTMFGLFKTGRYEFTPAQVTSIGRYGVIPIIGSGIRICHTVPDYPEKIVFWCSPGSTLRGIAESGFSVPDMQAGHHPAAEARGFPLRAGPLIVAVLIWNFFLGLEFFGQAGFVSFPGPLSFAAVALLFVASLAALRLPGLQAILLRPGRSIGEVRPVFVLLATVSGLMTIVFGIMFIVRSIH